MSNQVVFSKQNQSVQNESSYLSFNVTLGNTVVGFLVVSGKHNYINITVKNASNLAYRGTGKQFNTFAEAAQNYKSEKMRRIINAAAVCNSGVN